MGNLINNNINDYDLFIRCVDYSDDKTPEEIGEMTPEQMVQYLGYNSISEFVASERLEEEESEREYMIEKVMSLPLSGNECGMILRSMRLI